MSRAEILAELKAAGERRRVAERDHHQAIAELAHLVKRAEAEGIGMTEVARVTGLARSRIYKLLDK